MKNRGDKDITRAIRLNGDAGQTGEVPASTAGGTMDWIDPFTEWEDADGSGVSVSDLTTPMRRNGDFGTSEMITDSAGLDGFSNFPLTAATAPLFNNIYAVPLAQINADGSWSYLWYLPLMPYVFEMTADPTQEATAANVIDRPCPETLEVKEISMAATSVASGGDFIAEIKRVVVSTGAETTLATLTIPANASDTGANGFDGQTNKLTKARPTMSATVPAGNVIRIDVSASTCTTFPTGLVVSIVGGVQRIGKPGA